MGGLVPATHDFLVVRTHDVDGRAEYGHDGSGLHDHCVSRMPVNFHCDSSSMA